MTPRLVSLTALLGGFGSAILALIAAPDSFGSEPPAPLLLVAELDGVQTDEIGTNNGRLVLRIAGKTRIADRRVVWKLEGDLIAHADKFYFSPNYEVERVAPQSRGDAFTSRPIKISFDVSNITRFFGNSGGPVPLNRDNIALRPPLVGSGIAVFIWVNDRVVSEVLPIAFDEISHGTMDLATLRLTEDEARGAPLVLLRGAQEQNWKRPVRWFDSPDAEEVLVAIHFRNDDAIREAVSRVRHVNETGWRLATLLHLTAEAGSEAGTGALLAKGATSDLRSDTGSTPINWAVRTGRLGTTTLLLEHAAHATDDRARFPARIEQALKVGMPEIAFALLKADPAWQTKGGTVDDIARSAAVHGQSDILRQMVANGCAASVRNVGAAGLVASVVGNSQETTAVLLEAGVDPNTAVGESTPLTTAITCRRLDLVRQLLRGGASPDFAAKSSPAPLILAVWQNDVDLTRALLDAGATVAPSGPGQTPLAAALVQGSRPLLTLLAEHGARADVHDAAFETVLMKFLELDEVTFIRGAVDDGWDRTRPLDGRWPPLFVATHYEATNVATWLRSSGCVEAPANLSSLRELDVSPVVITSPLPKETRFVHPPDLAKGAEIAAVLDESGSLNLIRIIGSPNENLSQLLSDALPSWRFKPPRKGGKPAIIRIRFVVHCELDPKTKAPRTTIDSWADHGVVLDTK